MVVSISDRNLLLGFLALQNDFISREELIAGVSVWLQDKSQSLDDILRQHGVVRDDELQILQALVEVHLAKHGGNVEETLTGLSSIASVRDELIRLGDAGIEHTLTHVNLSTQAEQLQTETLPFGAAGADGHRFTIVRPHAKGGLGEVFVAHDNELNREVALKEIQSGRAHDPNSRTRFVLEAEVTGSLEHPGIVPVYGLGHYDDGRPYYAMRFVHGDSLKQAVDGFHKSEQNDRVLQLRKLLGRFVDVCNAIQYAHSRGVLHRDLKPDNVMLGKYGETLVVDWGLAKIRGRDDTTRVAGEDTLQPSSGSASAPTQMGSAIGTPAFMSPEQAAGQLDEVRPASDVYSLGATLYYLLCGQSPFTDKNLGVVLRKVQAGEFPAPRQVDSRVPRSLGAICLKAMATKIDDRYDSPDQLANDVEKWLADEPVSAHADSIADFGSRWMRRHRSWTLAGAAALFLVAAVSTMAVLMINRSLQSEAEQRRNAVTAREVAEERSTQLVQAYSENEKLLEQLAAQEAKVAKVAQEKAELSASIAALSQELSRSVSATEKDKLKAEISQLAATIDAKNEELKSERARLANDLISRPRFTTDAGSLLGKSSAVKGVEAQKRNPVVTDPRVRGNRVGKLLSSG